MNRSGLHFDFTTEFPVPVAEWEHTLSAALMAPAEVGVRVVALDWLYKLVDARDRWQAVVDGSGHDAEQPGHRADAVAALHKARVSLRRLRATLREHRVTLDLHEGKRIRRALRRLGQITGKVRDRDVQREWLETERDALGETAREQADLLLRQLADDAANDHAKVARAFAKHLDPVAKPLAKRLSRYTTTQVIGQPVATIPLARHLASRMERSAARVRHDLGMEADVANQDALHRVRLRLKNQRAMLAPFAGHQPELSAWYAMATRGQNMLGAMRDATLLAKRARQHDLTALADALDSEALAHYEAFTATWCRGAKDKKQEMTQDMTQDMMHEMMQSMTAAIHALREVPAMHETGLPMEIERKFLLHGLPPEAAVAPSIRIEQGWLPGTTIRERLRRTTEPTGLERCTRTIKLGQPGHRIEIEEVTDPVLFAQLWPLTVAARIRKRRHLVVDGDVTWEIDVFLDRDLVLAEVELRDEHQTITLPDWLAPFVAREVTHDTSYLNSVMAQPHVGTPNHELQ